MDTNVFATCALYSSLVIFFPTRCFACFNLKVSYVLVYSERKWFQIIFLSFIFYISFPVQSFLRFSLTCEVKERRCEQRKIQNSSVVNPQMTIILIFLAGNYLCIADEVLAIRADLQQISCDSSFISGNFAINFFLFVCLFGSAEK